jgi:hypothetical protein
VKLSERSSSIAKTENQHPYGHQNKGHRAQYYIVWYDRTAIQCSQAVGVGIYGYRSVLVCHILGYMGISTAFLERFWTIAIVAGQVWMIFAIVQRAPAVAGQGLDYVWVLRTMV